MRLRRIAQLSAALVPALAQPWASLPGSLYGPLGQPWGSCAEASWPLSPVGAPLVPQSPDMELAAMLAEVDPKRIEATITTLAGFGTRHTLSAQNSSTRGIGAARDWILGQMRGFASGAAGAKMDVYFDSHIEPKSGSILFPTNVTNVVARINGTTDPGRVYVVTGHYDSRRLNLLDYTGDAPGADDNASGVAVVLELARVCAMRPPPKATVIFAATACEEQNMCGSAHLAASLKKAGVRVEANLNNDIVGTGSHEPTAPINQHTVRLFGASILYPNASAAAANPVTDVPGAENDSPARNLGRFVAEISAGAALLTDMQVALVYRPDRFSRGSDHESFLDQGWPAVRFAEAVEDFKHQHQDPRVQDGVQYGDLVKYVDFEYTARVARVNLAAIWSAANAPAQPTNVTMSRTVGFPARNRDTPPNQLSNESRFAWRAGEDPLVTSYELVWRSTGSLQWQYSMDVGNVGNATVNLPKDDFQFGIRAVGKDGKKSPAVFPLPR